MCLGREKNALITTPAAASPPLVPVYSKAGFENSMSHWQSADEKYNNKGMEKETKNDFLMMHKKRPFQMGLSNDFTSDTTHTGPLLKLSLFFSLSLTMLRVGPFHLRVRDVKSQKLLT